MPEMTWCAARSLPTEPAQGSKTPDRRLKDSSNSPTMSRSPSPFDFAKGPQRLAIDATKTVSPEPFPTPEPRRGGMREEDNQNDPVVEGMI
jgi:hypothetical protein